MTTETTPAPPSPSWGSRLLAGIATLSVAGIAAGAVFGATAFLSQQAQSVEAPDPGPLVRVDARPLSMLDGFQVPRAFIGQIEPPQSTELAFEPAGTVMEITVDEGDEIAKGDVVARLDRRALNSQKRALLASRDALEAQAELARLTSERRKKLNREGFSTTQSYDEARLRLAELTARIAETNAAIAGVDVDMDKAVLRAPFDGRVSARHVDEGASIGAGRPVVTLLERGAPTMRVGIAPIVAAGLSQGDVLSVNVSGRTYPAVITRLRPDVDPVTRTRSAIVELDAPEADGAMLYGQTGSVHLFQTVAQAGAWVPVGALREGVRGVWTVMTATPEDGAAVARLAAVEILHATQSEAFVRGTFTDGTLLIAQGPHRVTPGQRIRIDGE